MTRRPAAEIETMAELRQCIDAIDDELMQLLAERITYIDRAPALKRREGISARAPSRVTAVLEHVRHKAQVAGFDPQVAHDMWAIMIDAMIAREEKTLGTDGQDG